MFKKMMVMVGIMLLPGIVFAQFGGMEEFKIKHNEFSVGANFINMKPINDYIGSYGFSAFGDMPLIFGYAQKNQIDNKTYWGIRFMTTLSGFAALIPNFLKREISSVDGTNKAEMSITMGEFLFEYEVLKFGGFFVNAGAGLGFGGTTLTLLGANSGKFWMASLLLKPQARTGYHFFEETGVGFILALNASYNYLPVVGWNSEAGSLPCPPGPGSSAPFDLSGLSVDVSITSPFTTK